MLFESLFSYFFTSLLGSKPKFDKLMTINIAMGLVMILLVSLFLESFDCHMFT